MNAETIRARRLALQWNQDQLAQAAGVSRSAVSNAEGGRRANKPTKLAAILNALDVEERSRAQRDVPADAPGASSRTAFVTLQFVDSDGGSATYKVPVGDRDPYEVAQAMIEGARRVRRS